MDTLHLDYDFNSTGMAYRIAESFMIGLNTLIASSSEALHVAQKRLGSRIGDLVQALQFIYI